MSIEVTREEDGDIIASKPDDNAQIPARRLKARHTVDELRAVLADFPGDLVVRMEGCDCAGDWNGLVSAVVNELYLGRDE